MDNYRQSIGTMLAAETTRLFLQPDGILVGYSKRTTGPFRRKKWSPAYEQILEKEL